eukprot:SAG31_NODE_22852_length_524_cov_1.633094_1_plen_41_part_10
MTPTYDSRPQLLHPTQLQQTPHQHGRRHFRRFHLLTEEAKN